MISDYLNLPFPLGFELLLQLPVWAAYLVLGFLVLGLLSASGFILARLGHSPLWALVLIVPLAQIIAYWTLALKRWPREIGQSESGPSN
jgi:hypothetical protein